MSVTIFGLFTLAVCGVLFFTRGPLSLLIAVIAFSLMGGSAALILWSLGGASIKPALTAMVVLGLAVVMPGDNRAGRLGSAVRQNIYLVFFALYGLIGAVFLPRIFAGAMEVAPMRVRLSYLFETFPLAPSSTNITQGFYLFVTMMAAISAYIACHRPDAHRYVVLAGVMVTFIHVYLGISDVLFSGTPYETFLDFFRNATYSQTDQIMGGIARMNGIMPEPSNYAAYGLMWFGFCSELWLRGVRPLLTGSAAFSMLFALIFSLSSTAYVGLGGYSILLIMRFLLIPGAFSLRKALILASGVFVVAIIVSAMLIAVPGSVDHFANLIQGLTVEKSASSSGQQRFFWAKQGLDAFVVSYGLGIGPGSFMSSSIVTAIIGSTGLIGILCIIAHVLSVLKPWRRSTFRLVLDEKTATGVAAAWAIIVLLIPASVSATTPDPGLLFGLLSGVALGMRRTDLTGSFPAKHAA